MYEKGTHSGQLKHLFSRTTHLGFNSMCHNFFFSKIHELCCDLIIMYKCLNGLVPGYLSSNIVKRLNLKFMEYPLASLMILTWSEQV